MSVADTLLVERRRDRDPGETWVYGEQIRSAQPSVDLCWAQFSLEDIQSGGPNEVGVREKGALHVDSLGNDLKY